METSAVAKFVRISPRKIRLIMDQVRGKKVEEALNMLSFAPQKGALILKKLINSAVANAEQNSGVDVDALLVKRVYADEGPTLKRFRPRAQGRATKIRKRSSHLTVVLDEE
ncbi:MAG: 50S ribosomal protein L22 [Deltaproteobacteria bacterium]|nr:50S ribosomal protein L22 [Deltaproteobacteria bacterium]MBW2344170.1 50S ribosomal protein L22 [Deltaproteobacteria bacterium]